MHLKIPFEFISQRCSLSWVDIQYGLSRQVISPEVAIEYANQLLRGGKETSPALLDLAGKLESDSVSHLVDQLARIAGCLDSQTTAEKWVFLVLAWIFENRDRLADPLALVEQVYSDFGYPQAVARFVRYMPMQGPDLGSREKNEARLILNWEQYLRDNIRKFSPASP